MLLVALETANYQDGAVVAGLDRDTSTIELLIFIQLALIQHLYLVFDVVWVVEQFDAPGGKSTSIVDVVGGGWTKGQLGLDIFEG